MDLGDMEQFGELQSPLTPKENEQLNGFPLDDAWFSKTATYDIFEEMEETRREFICGAFETTSSISTAPNSPAVNDYDTFEITDDELRNLPVKQLNQKLRDLPKSEACKLRKRRRSLKNRGYALNCRNKRLTENEQLKERNKKLVRDVAKIKDELSKAIKERDMFKQKYEQINSVFSTICTTSAMTSLKGVSVSKS